MELTVVGCSGSTSGPSSAASSYLLRAPHRGRTFSLVLDLGPGAFGQLYRHLDPRDVDAIGLSHLHPDHCLDVCGFYVAARYSDPADPWPSIPLFGPVGTAERIGLAYQVAGTTTGEGSAGIGDHFTYRTWAPEQQIGPFRVTARRVAHPVPAYAVRVGEDRPGGATLVYSGDTGPCDALVDLARGADLLLAEAAFRDGDANPPGVHLSGREAAETAERAGVGELVLTHIPPWHQPADVLAEATPHFAGPVSLAAAGLRRPVRRADGPVGAGP